MLQYGITSTDDIMRAIIDLPEQQLSQLQALCIRQGISRAEAVRRAISLYDEQAAPESREQGLSKAFGLWRKREKSKFEGVAYQRALRADWDSDRA